MPGGRRLTPIAAAAGTFFQKAGELQGRALRRGRIKTRDCHSKRGLWTMSRADSGNEKRTSKPNTWVSFLLFVDFSGEGAGTGARRGFGALPDGARPIALTGACGLAPAFFTAAPQGQGRRALPCNPQPLKRLAKLLLRSAAVTAAPWPLYAPLRRGARGAGPGRWGRRF